MKWKRIAGWSAAILLALIIVAVIAASMIVRTAAFHRYVLAKIVQQAHDATGATVEIRNFDFRLSGLTADLYGVTLHGTERPNERPLLQVDKITVGLKILSVLRRQLNLSNLQIYHPVASVIVAKDSRNNLPQPPASKDPSSSTDVFDLAVGHVLLTGGELYYNDKQSSMDADVRDLRAEMNYTMLLARYSGTISYHDGRIRYTTLSPLPHTLNAKFNATRSGLSFDQLDLTIGSSHASVQAKVTDYNNPKLDGNYDILFHTQDAAGLITGSSVAGDVALTGSLHYSDILGQALLQNVSTDGHIESNGLALRNPQGHVELQKIRGRYQLANGNLQTKDMIVNLLRGELRAALEMQHLDTTRRAKLHVSLRGISLEAARNAVTAPSAKQLPLTGNVEGTADASWSGSFQALQAHSDARIHGSIINAGKGRGSSAPVPLEAALHVEYDSARSVITVRPSTVKTPATSIFAQGQVSDRSNLTIQGNTTNLQELAALASAFSSSSSKPISLSGTATLNATVQGPVKQPRLSAQVSARNLQVDGSQWSTLQFGAAVSASEIELTNGLLVSAQQGQVAFNGKVGLRDWSYSQANPIAATLSVKQMPIAKIEQLANLRYPVTGMLNADISIQGSQLNPVGHGSVKLINATVYEEPVQNLALDMHTDGGSLISTLNMKLPAGSVTGNASFTPRGGAYRVQISAPSIALEQLHTVRAKGIALTGTVNATASGAGTLDDPQLEASVQLPKLQLRETAITGIKLEMKVAQKRAQIALNSDVAGSHVRANAAVNLTGDYYTEASIDTSKVALEPLLVLYVPNHPSGFQGQTELHAILKGPLKDKSRMEARLEIPTLTASYQSLQIAATGPIRAHYANSTVVLEPGELKGTGSSLRFQGEIPIGNSKPMALTAQGSVDLHLLEMISKDYRSSGTIALDVHTQGRSAQGQIELKNVTLSTTASPLGLEDFNGKLAMANGSLEINQITGQIGGGQVSATGTIAYQPEVQFNVAVNAQSVRLRYPDGVRTLLSGNLALGGSTQDASLNGRVLIDSLSFSSDFDLGTFMAQFAGESAPPTSQGFADNLKLNVAVQSTEELSAASSAVSLEGQANLRVIGTAANPVIVGRTDLTAGDIFFMKRRYQLERGIINFNNPNHTDPIVNMLITTTVNQYNLSLTIVGPIEKLRTSYVSDPPLPPVDIINLIARGATTEESSPSSLGANSILAQGLASQVGNSVQKLAGISSLQIDPLLGGNNRNPSARVAIQQRLTKNFIFTFSTDVTDPQSEIIQGEYQLSKRWSVSVVRDEHGGVGVDGRFHTNF